MMQAYLAQVCQGVLFAGCGASTALAEAAPPGSGQSERETELIASRKTIVDDGMRTPRTRNSERSAGREQQMRLKGKKELE